MKSGKAKENAQPNGKVDLHSAPISSALGPTPSVSATFRPGLYVDSCDAAELNLGRNPISEVKKSAGRKADPQHANPMLDDEAILAEYCTLAEFTFGLPRYHVIFTSHRIILKEKQRFFGLLGKDAEEFVCYRDLVDASMGKPACSWTLPIAACAAALGLLLFSLLLIADQKAAAVGILCMFLVSSAGITSYNVAMEHFLEGVDLSIDVCKTGKIVPSWPVRTNNQSAKSFHVRLPPDQATAAMKLLLGHSEFGLLSSTIVV